MKKFYIYFITTMLLSSCASTVPIKIGANTYYSSKTNYAGIFGDVGATTGDLIVEGNHFCESLGKELQLVTQSNKDNVPGVRFGGSTITFKCVNNASDPVMRSDRGISTVEIIHKLKASFDCITETIIANEKVKEITYRQAKSTPGMIFKIKPEYTKLIVETDYNGGTVKSEVKFRSQVEKMENGYFFENITNKGFIYDVYAEDSSKYLEQYYVPSGVNDSTIMANIIKFATDKNKDKKYVFFMKCWNEFQSGAGDTLRKQYFKRAMGQK